MAAWRGTLTGGHNSCVFWIPPPHHTIMRVLKEPPPPFDNGLYLALTSPPDHNKPANHALEPGGPPHISHGAPLRV